MNCSTPGLPVHHQLLEFKLMSIKSVMLSSHLILCRPLLLLPPISPSIRVFSNESVLIKWPKCWSFSFSISLPMNIQDWSPLGWTGWTSLQSKGLPRVFSSTRVQKHQFFHAQWEQYRVPSASLCLRIQKYWLLALSKTFFQVNGDEWSRLIKVLSLRLFVVWL